MKSSSFMKHVITLASGTALAQVISVSIVPVLTRLYSPDEFGGYAVFSSILAVLGVVSTGRYEYAIIASGKDEDAWQCMILVFVISIIGTVLIFFVGFFGGAIFERALNIKVTSSIVALAATALFASGASQGAYYWLNRNKRYTQLSASRIFGALIMAGVSCSLGYMGIGAEGLLYGLVAGQVANLAVLFLSIIRYDRSRGGAQWRQIKYQALKHIDYPKYLIPSSILDRFSSQSHIILLSSFFGASVSGALGLYQRVVSLPNRLVGSAIADVFKQRAGVALNEYGECRLLFRKAALRLLLLGLPPFLVLVFTGPFLFALVFGEEWRLGGEYAQILSWMFLFGFVVSPLSSLFFVGRKQRYDLIMQIFLIISTSSALIVGAYLFDSVRLSLFLFTFSYCVKYLIEGWLAWRIANGSH